MVNIEPFIVALRARSPKHRLAALAIAATLVAPWPATAANSKVWGWGGTSFGFEQSSVVDPLSFDDTWTLVRTEDGSGAGSTTKGAHQAAASAAHQTLRASTSIDYSTGLRWAGEYDTNGKTHAAFEKLVVVDAGTSGLTDGDALTLMVTLRLDGHVVAAGLSPNGIAIVQSRMRYKLHDQDDTYDRILFDYTAKHEYETYVSSGSPVVAETRKEYWGIQGQDGSWSDLHDVDFYSRSGSTIDVPIDTGAITLSFDTFVGRTLRVEAWLDIWASAGAMVGAFKAEGSFGSTFDAELRASTPGIVLLGETPGVYGALPVPEPGSWALMLAGLGLLGTIAKRRRSR